ncbi:hypothetical protein ACPPVO_33330 [Dactylosporangium sp. McL0621]|uniref:hypothetical protein n=1 Tax=Dactylosporangium sp. McL0621 TaxID=3415678 RepID=UPI003CEF2175
MEADRRPSRLALDIRTRADPPVAAVHRADLAAPASVCESPSAPDRYAAAIGRAVRQIDDGGGVANL